MNNLHSDRAEKQTLNAPEASRSHHDVIDAFVTSHLGDSFRHETSFEARRAGRARHKQKLDG